MSYLTPCWHSFQLWYVTSRIVYSTINTDILKLYFLLSQSPTSLYEDDPTFRSFFESRYVSLAYTLRKDTPSIWAATMKWLSNEVFVQKNNEEMEEMEREQREFEDDLVKAIGAASDVRRREREAAVRIIDRRRVEEADEEP